MRRLTTSLVVVGSLFLIGGCSAPGELPEFQRDRTTADEIPFDVSEARMDADSSRLAGEDSAGTIYYLVRAEDSNAPCVVVVPAEEPSWSGCGGVGMKARGPDGSRVEIVDPGMTASNDPEAEKISQSLLAYPAG